MKRAAIAIVISVLMCGCVTTESQSPVKAGIAYTGTKPYASISVNLTQLAETKDETRNVIGAVMDSFTRPMKSLREHPMSTLSTWVATGAAAYFVYDELSGSDSGSSDSKGRLVARDGGLIDITTGQPIDVSKLSIDSAGQVILRQNPDESDDEFLSRAREEFPGYFN